MTVGRESGRPRVYMALTAGDEAQDKLQFLTTRVMRWSEQSWILDISPFVRYWRTRAQSAGVTVVSLWRTALNRIFEPTGDSGREKVIAISPPYRAACATNPWLALLMLYGMEARGVQGLVWQQSRTGKSLLSGTSWDVWWRGTVAVNDHFLAVKRKGFQPARFRAQCHRLKLGVARLGFRLPGEMHILNEQGVKKRFGSELALLWRWTFDETVGRSREGSETGSGQAVPFLYRISFPWQGFRFREPLLVKRYPDYSLEHWEQIAPLLSEDLDRLCLCLEKSGEQVVRLDWTVTLEDLTCLQVPILFRNPHDLRREAGDHRTALSQARYAFEDAAREHYPPSPEGDVETVLLISNWELALSESLVVPDVCFDIFGEMAEKEGELDILLRLENELPVVLNRFSTIRDWLPEDSYTCRELAWEEAEDYPTDMQRSLDAIAEERPLYIRSKPLPLKVSDRKSRGRFLESTLDKWWQKGGPALIERNYFKHVDGDGNATWIFRDSAGEWYQHGIFG